MKLSWEQSRMPLLCILLTIQLLFLLTINTFQKQSKTKGQLPCFIKHLTNYTSFYTYCVYFSHILCSLYSQSFLYLTEENSWWNLCRTGGDCCCNPTLSNWPRRVKDSICQPVIVGLSTTVCRLEWRKCVLSRG